jgi:capsular polysaccharide biosynthesis protein
MEQTRPDHSIVQSTPIHDWLRSEGLLSELELARSGKNLPDTLRDRILRTRTGAKGERTASNVTSTRVIPAEPRETVPASRLTVDGPCPKEFSHVARHLPAMVYEVRGGRIFVGHQRTTVILGEDRYLEPGSSSAGPWIAPLLARAPMALRVAGTVAVLYANGARMFSHWMFDLLPKIEVLRRAGWTESNVDFFIVNPAPADFQKDTLRILGIPEHKIMMSEGLLLEADTLLFPSRIRIGFKTPPWVRAFVRDRFGPSECNGSGEKLKIYVSRGLARGRRVENEEAIREVLERRGYRTVYAENHAVGDFARLVARAEAIAAPHGAGLANVVFAPDGVQVLEMYGAQLTQEYWLLASGIGGQHFLLPGKDHDQKYPWQSAEYPELSYHERNIADFHVDLSDLQRALTLMNQSAI